MVKQKIFLLFVFVVFFLFPFFSFAQTSDLQSLVAQLQKQVLELQIQIKELKAELGQQIPQTSVSTEIPASEPISTEPIPEFTKTLSRGSSGDEVRKLQEFLKKDREIYPEGLITGYFGPKTEEALKKWQTKHNIEAVGILGPQSRARFLELGHGKIKELITEGAGASGVIPPGLQTAPGIQKKLEVSTTTQATTTPPQSVEDFCPKDSTKCYTEKTCKAQNFYWYTVFCHKEPPKSGTCAESNAFCINSDECSNGGYYWCRNSCYATSTACLGQTFVAPVQPATPAVPAVVTTTTTTSSCESLLPYSGSHISDITSTSAKVNWDTFRSVTNEIRYSTSSFTDINSPNLTVVTSPLVSGTSYGGSPYYSLIISNLLPSTKYYYTIVMKENCGRTTNTPLYEYAYSFTTTAQTVTTTDTTAPSTPTGLTASLYSPKQVNLYWTASTDNVGVTGYKIYRNEVNVVSVSGTSFTDYPGGISYTYTVVAHDAAGNISAQSNAVSSGSSSIPQVQGLTATVSGNSVNLSWQDVSNTTYSLSGSPNNLFGSFEIYQDTSPNYTPYPNALVVKSTALSYTDSNRPAGTYYYKIALQDKNGVVGPASSAVSVVIVATTTSNINSDTASRLAQILESFNSILNSLKLLR